MLLSCDLRRIFSSLTAASNPHAGAGFSYVYLAAGVWFYVVWSVSQATLHLGPDVRVDGVGNYVRIADRASRGNYRGAAWLAAPLLVVFWFAFMARKAATWRRARGERRKQLTWLMSGGMIMTVSIVVTSVTNAGGERVVSEWRRSASPRCPSGSASASSNIGSTRSTG